MTSSNISLRPVTEADVPEMVDVFNSAFADSPFNARCFPSSDPASAVSNINLITSDLTNLVIAEDAAAEADPSTGQKRILGWARWIRHEAPHADRPPFPPEAVPPSGDADLAVRFFGINRAQVKRIVGQDSYWLLSLLVVRRDAQRRGVGAALMRHGLEKADRDGWMSIVNGSPVAKRLYESTGFETYHVSDFGGGITTYHMKRDPKPT